MDTHRGETVPVWREAFAKILALEEHKGFGDNAVSGGIRRFIERWEPELRAFLDDDPNRVATLISAPYRELPEERRRQWVSAWRSVLAGEKHPPVPDPDLPARTTPDAPATFDPAAETHLFDPGAAFQHVRVRRRQHAAPRLDANPGDPEDPVSAVRRMDARTVQRLESLGAGTVRDLLYMFPRRYDDRADVTSIADIYAGGTFTLEGELVNIRSTNVGQRRLQLAEGTLRDDTGAVDLQWFGQGFLARTLRAGNTMVVHGKAEIYRGRLTINSPEYDVVTGSAPPLNAGRITPVYRLTQGMTARNLRSLTWRALERFLGGVVETMPESTRARTQLVGLRQAIGDAHYPPDLLQADLARRRLAFDEILAFQMSILGRRRYRERDAIGIPVQHSAAAVDGFQSELPFTPTRAQVRCIGEILADMARGTPPMSRLLQGEVGSGKTLVALTAILAAASDHRQSALMAPTEVLSEQHFATVGRLLSSFEQPLQQPNVFSAYLPSLRRPFTVGLLTGSTRAAPRREALRLASEGHLDLLIGTHALIQDGVELPNLALAITDEQHRFGVAQRTALRGAGPEQPHALMMSATPIPRTLQLTLYGDLDVSTIDELPPGRQDILTRLVPEDKRAAAYSFVRQQVEAGRQAFIICPLVEESDNLDVRAATEEHKRLSNEVFPDLKLGLLHGRLSSRDKDKVMRQFRDGELDVLVATAVVEVGIDVPNATVMMIDGADRFGLAQLHQFRGRVGRGEHRSYCLLMSESESERVRERLSALENNRDGFKLAEIDLQMRHEGDIFGTTQSGDQTMLRITNVFDQDLMALARQEAAAILDADPDLTDPKHAGIVAERDRFLARVQDNISD
jgi:ATP-dependent DNA helicase RecG